MTMSRAGMEEMVALTEAAAASADDARQTAESNSDLKMARALSSIADSLLVIASAVLQGEFDKTAGPQIFATEKERS